VGAATVTESAGFVPGYWMRETSGVLRPAVEAYLGGGDSELTEAHCAALRAYLRQWMAAPFMGDGIDLLRARVDTLTSRAQINQWVNDALDLGIDPF